MLPHVPVHHPRKWTSPSFLTAIAVIVGVVLLAAANLNVKLLQGLDFGILWNYRIALFKGNWR